MLKVNFTAPNTQAGNAERQRSPRLVLPAQDLWLRARVQGQHRVVDPHLKHQGFLQQRRPAELAAQSINRKHRTSLAIFQVIDAQALQQNLASQQGHVEPRECSPVRRQMMQKEIEESFDPCHERSSQ